MQNHPDIEPSLEIQSDSGEILLEENNVGIHFCDKFSIRDYVFASRYKDIGKNWPFRLECLQVCMKHGIKDFLPPFEPPGLARVKPCTEDVDLNNTEEEKSCAGPCWNYRMNSNAVEEAMKFTDDLYKEDIISGVSKQIGILSLSGIRLENMNDKDTTVIASKPNNGNSGNPEGQVLEIPPFLLASEDRCDLLHKLDGSMKNIKEIVQGHQVVSYNTLSENRSEFNQIRDNLSAHVISDPIKRQSHKLNKHKRKARKKRSMVEISAKARPCTLEELDRLNGLDWAMDSSVTPCGDLEHREGFAGEGNGSIKAVDLSGTGHQISPNFESCNCIKKLVCGFLLTKHQKIDNKDESCFFNKRRRIVTTNSKGCKFKSQNGKLSSFIMNETKIPLFSAERSQDKPATKIKIKSQPALQDQEIEKTTEMMYQRRAKQSKPSARKGPPRAGKFIEDMKLRQANNF